MLNLIIQLSNMDEIEAVEFAVSETRIWRIN
jgi:hypothetical protein